MLGDEINRASPKTQSALLECMEERQVTVDGATYPLEPPFMVIATQNPIEMEGTYPLPEAQRDRFTARISIGYPDRGGRAGDAGRAWLVVAARRPQAGGARSDVRALIAAVRDVHVADQVRQYIIDLVNATRIVVGAAPRRLAARRAASAAREPGLRRAGRP